MPIAAGRKSPPDGLTNWPELRYFSDRQLEDAFPAGLGVGVLLGAASGGLVDVDLDCAESRGLAASFLPRTPLTHGRRGAPDSHYWYVVDHEVATQQYKDPTDQSMLLELRSTGAQTVIPPSTHPSGEQLLWSDSDADPANISKVRLTTHVRVLAAACLLARHWPASGGRHDASMALAGGLLRSGWTEKNASYLVAEVGAAVDPGVDRKDRRSTVSSTAKLLEKDGKTWGWAKLSEFIGGVVVAKAREWLNLENDETEDEPTEDRLTRADIATMLEEGIPEPEWLMEGVFYKQAIHWMAGEPGCGKTIMLLGLADQLMRAGKTVMWVDEEAGERQTAYRLQAYKADPDVIRERFHYFNRPGLSISDEDRHALFTMAREVKPDVIFFDSVGDMLDAAELDEDNNSEVNRWAKAILEPLKFEYDTSVVVIDHVTKSKESRGGWARGAGAKKGKTDVLWRITKVKEFTTSLVGLIRLEPGKDRDGCLPLRAAYRIGGQGGRIILEAVDAVATGERKVPEEEVPRRVVEFLRLNAECEEDSVTLSGVQAAVTGKNEAIRDALLELGKDEETGVRVLTRGSRQRWWYEEDTGFEIDFSDTE